MPTRDMDWSALSAEDQEWKDFVYAFRLQSLFVVSKSKKSEVSFGDCWDLRCRFGGYPSCHRMKKIFVSPRGVYSFPDNSYGIKWVGLHGMEDSICIVARRSDVDLKRVGLGLRQVPDDLILHYITVSLQTELEGISKANYSADKLHDGPGLAMNKPFGVVSVNPSKDGVDDSIHPQQAKDAAECDAIHFLRKKMLANPVTTMQDTIQTAISAFQLLCREELKAEDICVSVCPKIPLLTTTLSTNEIKEHLALIKGCSMTSKLTVKSSSLTSTLLDLRAKEFPDC